MYRGDGEGWGAGRWVVAPLWKRALSPRPHQVLTGPGQEPKWAHAKGAVACRIECTVPPFLLLLGLRQQQHPPRSHPSAPAVCHEMSPPNCSVIPSQRVMAAWTCLCPQRHRQITCSSAHTTKQGLKPHVPSDNQQVAGATFKPKCICFQSRCHQWPQTWWLKTAQINFPSVLEARVRSAPL